MYVWVNWIHLKAENCEGGVEPVPHVAFYFGLRSRFYLCSLNNYHITPHVFLSITFFNKIIIKILFYY